MTQEFFLNIDFLLSTLAKDMVKEHDYFMQIINF